MKKETTATNPLAILSNVTTDMKIDFTELVNIHVAKYESELYNRKDTLSKSITNMKGERENLKKTIMDKLKLQNAHFNSVQPILHIKTVLEEVSVNITKERAEAHLKVTTSTTYKKFNSGFSINIEVEMNESDVMKYRELSDQISSLDTELNGILMMIKDISRKEREIRGKLSEMKLEQQGLTDLLALPGIQDLLLIDKK